MGIEEAVAKVKFMLGEYIKHINPEVYDRLIKCVEMCLVYYYMDKHGKLSETDRNAWDSYKNTINLIVDDFLEALYNECESYTTIGKLLRLIAA